MFEFFLLAFVGYLIYYYLFAKSSPPAYWKEHGIPFIDTSAVATNFEIFLMKKQILDRDEYAYNQLGSIDGKFCGMLESPKPVILLKDIDLIKKVCIKDFDHFIDRRDFIPIKQGTIVSKMMLKGEEWKGVRTTVTPTFATGKVRRLMGVFNGVGKEFIDMLKYKTSSGETNINVLLTWNQYTVDVIGRGVFGVITGTIDNPNSEFAQNARRLTEFSLFDFIKRRLGPCYPNVFTTLGIDAFDEKALGFFAGIVRQSMEARRNGTVKRNDFLQLMLDAQKGELEAVSSEELSQFEKDAQLLNAKAVYLTDDLIVAQSVGFFLGGFLTISTFLTFVTYVLAVHQDIQEKLRRALVGVVKEDGTVEYDEINEIQYLDMVFCETLRLYPAAIRIERDCNKNFHDPETGLFVQKGSVVVIPVHPIHHDKEYYANPHKFDPEHFSPENKARRTLYAYFPFGHGPRNCTGMRFAMIEAKTVITLMLHSFRIEPTEKTPIPIQAITAGISFMPPTNLELKLVPLHFT